jgi:lysophospholipase L1-like esterase
MYRRLVACLALLLSLFAVACKDPGLVSSAPSASAGARKDLPSSMAALGDSITAGFGACFALTSCHRNSWATGDGTLVNSHYRRIVAGNPAMRGHAHNLADPGAVVADLPGQATRAVALHPQYVTILIGANDACGGGIEDMTSTAAFSAELRVALSVLAVGLPKAHVLVVSIPDVYRVWQVAHTSRVARQVWALGICPALLANPTSTAPADIQRRQLFRDRIDAYDRSLASACRAYGHLCRYDGGAAHRYAFSVGDLSVLDFFHPNSTGQNALARVTYPGRFTW